MARIVYLVLTLIAFNLAVLLFGCSSWDSSGFCLASNSSGSIWSYVISPQNFQGGIDPSNSSNLWDLLFGSATGLAAIAGLTLIVGSFISRSEVPLYLGMALVFAAQSSIIIKFFSMVQNSAFFTGREGIGLIVAIILVSPLIIAWIFTLIDWARGRD